MRLLHGIEMGQIRRIVFGNDFAGNIQVACVMVGRSVVVVAQIFPAILLHIPGVWQNNIVRLNLRTHIFFIETVFFAEIKMKGVFFDNAIVF